MSAIWHLSIMPYIISTHTQILLNLPLAVFLSPITLKWNVKRTLCWDPITRFYWILPQLWSSGPFNLETIFNKVNSSLEVLNNGWWAICVGLMNWNVKPIAFLDEQYCSTFFYVGMMYFSIILIYWGTNTLKQLIGIFEKFVHENESAI